MGFRDDVSPKGGISTWNGGRDLRDCLVLGVVGYILGGEL